MNKSIVWYSNDINKDKFSMEFTLQELISQDHLDYISDSKILVTYKVDSINDGIGLKDINKKEIYADSSIVEFKNIGGNYTGYFTFDIVKLCYKIIVLDIKSARKEFIFNSNNIENIKIIDTIQENKLGLIKA